MKTVEAVSCAALLWLFLVPVLALGQQVQAPPTVGGGRAVAPKGEAACFQKAGVPDSVWQQVHAIRQSAHQQVAAICLNTSLTPDQRQQQIKQAHAQAKRQIDALLTPQQLAGIKSCRAERHGDRTGGGGARAGGGGRGDVCAKVGGTKAKAH
jgi:Spy/CpxP family protein refolding chaperone